MPEPVDSRSRGSAWTQPWAGIMQEDIHADRTLPGLRQVADGRGIRVIAATRRGPRARCRCLARRFRTGWTPQPSPDQSPGSVSRIRPGRRSPPRRASGWSRRDEEEGGAGVDPGPGRGPIGMRNVAGRCADVGEGEVIHAPRRVHRSGGDRRPGRLRPATLSVGGLPRARHRRTLVDELVSRIAYPGRTAPQQKNGQM